MSNTETHDCIIAPFTGWSVFKIPPQYQTYPLDCFEVIWDTLYIYDKDTKQLVKEIKASLSAEDTIDWKRPEGELEFSKQSGWPIDEEDEEEEHGEDNEEEEDEGIGEDQAYYEPHQSVQEYKLKQAISDACRSSYHTESECVICKEIEALSEKCPSLKNALSIH